MGTRINRKAAQVYRDFLAERIEKLRRMEWVCMADRRGVSAKGKSLLNRISHFPFTKVTDRSEIPPRHKTDHSCIVHQSEHRNGIRN